MSILKNMEDTYLLNRFSSCVDEWHWDALSFNETLPFYYVSLFSEKPWDWYALSCHVNLDWGIVLSNLDKSWHWECLSLHKNTRWETIMKNPDLPWDWNSISMNPNITWEIVSLNPWKPWNWNILSLFLPVSIKTIQKFNCCPWNYALLICNSNIVRDLNALSNEHLFSLDSYMSWQNVNQIAEFRAVIPFIESEFESNEIDWEAPLINLETLRYFPDIPWNWEAFSKNPNVTIEIIKNPKNRDIFHLWDWDSFSLNPNVTFDVIEQNPKIPWNYEKLSMNKSVANMCCINKIKNTSNFNWSNLSKFLVFTVNVNSNDYINFVINRNIKIQKDIFTLQFSRTKGCSSLSKLINQSQHL